MSSKKSKKSKKKKSHKSKKDDKETTITTDAQIHNLKEKSNDKTKKREHSRSRSVSKKQKTDDVNYKKETHHHHHHHHYYHNSRSRSRSNSRKRQEKSYKTKHKQITESDNSMKFDKKKLLEIAKANVIKAASLQVQYTSINANIRIEDSASVPSKSSKSINELVEYCKKLSGDLNNDDTKVFHPYATKEAPEIKV
jgi:hypothetical protein